MDQQENVPDGPRVVHGPAGRAAVRGAHGHRAGGQQAVPVRVPPIVVAGGRQGGPASAAQAVHAPRLAVHRRSAPQTGRVLRKGQTHQQRDGQARTRKCFANYDLRNGNVWERVNGNEPRIWYASRDYSRITVAARGFCTRGAYRIS